MKKIHRAAFFVLLLSCMLLGGCSGNNTEQPQSTVKEAKITERAAESTVEITEEVAEEAKTEEKLPDGIYTAEFDTDNSMFRVNEAYDGKGILTVKNGEMTIHVTLGSKNIVKLYPGLSEDAKTDDAGALMPTEDSVTYSDGWTETVYGFDIPVPVLDEEFNLALIGKKDKWYDHKVRVSNPMPYESADKVYTIDLTFEGGSGKSEILSPALISVSGNTVTATLQWDSPNYDYMVVDGETYLPVNTEGNSVFEIPVSCFDEPITVIGDTVAMSRPHEIEYTITFHSDSVKAVEKEWSELSLEGTLELQYAENFSVDYYEGGYNLLTLTDGTRLLTIPDGMEVPGNLDSDITPVRQPVKDIYLVASAIMDMFCSLDALDSVSLSGQKEDGWYIEEARDAMARGDLVYAGKYNKPDYESILSNGCSLAIENMMISHSPEVVEKLESFGIPVMIDYSSYENHPLGRVEWIKFYGALLGKEKQADELFREQIEILDRVTADKKTDKTVAFFFITSNGLVQVRRPGDYVPKMIELAGGKYIYEELGAEDSARSTMNVQIEEFFNTAKDADYLIYNSSIDGGVDSVEELLDKTKILAGFKAVKEGHVWCTTNDMYQQSMSIGYLIDDIHKMLKDADVEDEELQYLFRLK